MGLVWIECDLVRRVFVVRDFPGWKMPSDVVTLVVSTGLGVSVLAGILSGMCYVFAHGVQRKSKRKLTKEWYCDVCGVYLKSIDHILGGNETVTCVKCRGRVCRRKCSSLNEQRSGWTCKNCLRPPESWLQGILNAINLTKKVEMQSNMQATTFDEVDEDLEALKQKGKEQVQDFLEKLVNAMLGQNVDDASVTKTYNDELYLPLTGQSPCTAHAALKQLIERLLREVVNLPHLQKAEENSRLYSDLNNKTYEDLLATAILNKVISSSQNTLPSVPSSSAASVSSRPTSSLSKRDEKEYFFGEETLDSKWKNNDLETTSISSLEEWIQSDSSFGSRKYVDRVTLTIKQDIEEVSQSESENEEDDGEYFYQKSLLTEDEPNWFLQKRQFQGTASPVPVPMLVPSPANEAKVLIGDKEADETSDLSDAGSDYEEADEKRVPKTHGLLLESKTVIGGKNPAQNGGSESESSADSGVKEVGGERFDYDDGDFVQRTDITVDDDNVEDASLLSVYSNTEKEAEYTERYGSLPRTILKTPTPPARPSLQKELCTSEANMICANTVLNQGEESDEECDRALERQFSGVYSRREKEKWKNAIEMKNNPYSKENIENRIKRSNSSVSSLFGPDYYAKLASSPSGDKKKSQEVNEKSMSAGFPGYDEEITGNLKNDAPGKIDVSWPPPRVRNEQNGDIHTAVPVIVCDEDTEDDSQRGRNVDRPAEEYLNGDYTTSDSDLSYVNCYDVEKSQVYKKSKEKPDENGNNPHEEDKHERATPTPKERPRYLKLNATKPNKNISKKTDTISLKRTQSEPDLTEDSFYTPPTVLTKRKDNTLISKIYQDLRVQSFAMSSRSKIPVEVGEVPTFRTQLSMPEIVLQGKNSLYISDDAATPHPKHTIYSSDEDLTLPKTSQEAGKKPQVVEVINQRLSTSRFSISSEEMLSEPGSATLERSKVSRPHLFSSFEDLVSAEEYEQPPKKKDNTLISRIYQQQNVRNYALSNRDYIPDESATGESASFGDVLSDDSDRVKSRISRTKSNTQEEIHLENLAIDKSRLPREPEEVVTERNVITPDQEISEIAKKKIVHNVLDQIATTQTKPTALRRKHVEEHREPTNEDDEKSVSVKELRRRFEKDQGTSRVVSSLTARSLSKQMKNTLKN